jgi:hypothetical protein
MLETPLPIKYISKKGEWCFLTQLDGYRIAQVLSLRSRSTAVPANVLRVCDELLVLSESSSARDKAAKMVLMTHMGFLKQGHNYSRFQLRDVSI